MKKNKGFLQLRRLEAARDIATLLQSGGNKVMLDSQSLLLNGMFRLVTRPSMTCADHEPVATEDLKDVIQK